MNVQGNHTIKAVYTSQEKYKLTVQLDNILEMNTNVLAGEEITVGSNASGYNVSGIQRQNPGTFVFEMPSNVVRIRGTYSGNSDAAYACKCCGAGIDYEGYCSACESTNTCDNCDNCGNCYTICLTCGKCTECCTCDDTPDPDICDHDWNNGTVIYYATCVTDGEVIYTCNICGEKYTEIVGAPGHDWDEGSVTVASTCIECGTKTYTCNRCGDTYTEELALSDHSWTQNSYISSVSCTTDEIESQFCLVCGAEREVVLATAWGHTYDYEENGDGTATYTCPMCGDSYTVDLRTGSIL